MQPFGRGRRGPRRAAGGSCPARRRRRGTAGCRRGPGCRRRPGGGVRQAVAGADHEAVECVFGVEATRSCWWGRLGRAASTGAGWSRLRGAERLRHGALAPNDEAHFYGAPDNAGQGAVNGGAHPGVEPVFDIGGGHADDIRAIFAGEQRGAAHPGIESALGNFHLKLAERRLPNLFELHR